MMPIGGKPAKNPNELLVRVLYQVVPCKKDVFYTRERNVTPAMGNRKVSIQLICQLLLTYELEVLLSFHS